MSGVGPKNKNTINANRPTLQPDASRRPLHWQDIPSLAGFFESGTGLQAQLQREVAGSHVALAVMIRKPRAIYLRHIKWNESLYHCSMGRPEQYGLPQT